MEMEMSCDIDQTDHSRLKLWHSLYMINGFYFPEPIFKIYAESSLTHLVAGGLQFFLASYWTCFLFLPKL